MFEFLLVMKEKIILCIKIRKRCQVANEIWFMESDKSKKELKFKGKLTFSNMFKNVLKRNFGRNKSKFKVKNKCKYYECGQEIVK